MSKKKIFKIVRGQLPGCSKAAFTGFIANDTDAFKDEGMYEGFIKRFNKKGWKQAGFTLKEFKEKTEMVRNVFKQEFNKSNEDGEPITAEACFGVEIWALSDAQLMLNTLDVAEKEGKGEEEIVEIFGKFVKKLQITKKEVYENIPIKKYGLAETETVKEEEVHEKDQKKGRSVLKEEKDKDDEVLKQKVDNVKSKKDKVQNVENPKVDVAHAKDAETAQAELKEKDGTSPHGTATSLQNKIESVTADLNAKIVENNNLKKELDSVTTSKDSIITSLKDTVKDKDHEITGLRERSKEFEDKIDKASSDNSEAGIEFLKDIKEDLAHIKEGVEKVLEHMGEDEEEKKGGKRKLCDVLEDMENFAIKQLKKPSVEDVRNKVRDSTKKIEQLSTDVVSSKAILNKLATTSNEKQDLIVSMLTKLNISAVKSSNPYEHIEPIHMSLAKTDKIAFVGDKIVHHMMRDNATFRYDLMPEAFVKSEISCFKKDLVQLGKTLGIWMSKVPKDVEVMILSFGLDDTLKHPEIELQKTPGNQQKIEQLKEENKPIVIALAKKAVDAVEIIGQTFPNTKVIYILPPTSCSEPVVIDLLRIELLLAWQKGALTSSEDSNISYIDSAEVLENMKSTEVDDTGPGHLTWLAGVKLAQAIYIKIFPESTGRFSTCCSSIHIEGACNKDCFGQSETEFGKHGRCRLCNSSEFKYQDNLHSLENTIDIEYEFLLPVSLNISIWFLHVIELTMCKTAVCGKTYICS